MSYVIVKGLSNIEEVSREFALWGIPSESVLYHLGERVFSGLREHQRLVDATYYTLWPLDIPSEFSPISAIRLLFEAIEDLRRDPLHTFVAYNLTRESHLLAKDVLEEVFGRTVRDIQSHVDTCIDDHICQSLQQAVERIAARMRFCDSFFES